MSKFIEFKTTIQKQFQAMGDKLFEVDLDKDQLFETYLSSFREGDNPIYIEKTEHDCNCCRAFIKNVGNVVSIVDGELVSIWDVQTNDVYQPVADAMSELVKSKKIKNVYLHFEKTVGTNHNFDLRDHHKWEHFFVKLPSSTFKEVSSIGGELSNTQSDFLVMQRSLEEFTLDAVEVVKDLILSNSIYRGEEHLETVKLIHKTMKQYSKLKNKKAKELFCWSVSSDLKRASRFRNSVIGTLIFDISGGIEIDKAVASFESKVAPTNYKRTSAVVTEGMKKNAIKRILELGLEPSLYRRHAVPEDITINNVLFADRNVRPQMKTLEDIIGSLPTKTKQYNSDKLETVSVETFLNDIVPSATEIEMYVGNELEQSFMSLIAPVHPDAPNMLKWDNNFSFSYNGNLADSTKDLVKKAGGDVSGDLRISLRWHNSDDLDLIVIEPNNNKIDFRRKTSAYSGAKLDVDMNAYDKFDAINPVENITWAFKNKILNGVHTVEVTNFNQRTSDNVGFEVEIEYLGKTQVISYSISPKEQTTVKVLSFSVKGDEIIINDHGGATEKQQVSKNVWNVDTEKFHRVDMVMKSPNHWDGNSTGNMHTFFILDGCINPDRPRGFYNEFLSNELTPDRKVFEVLASKMLVEYSDRQLSGIGISSTLKKTAIFKIKGSFNRTIKVQF